MTQTDSPIIELRHVDKHYGPLHVLRDISNILSIDNIDNYAYHLFIRQKGVAMMKLNLMCMCSMCMRWPASCPLCVHKQS